MPQHFEETKYDKSRDHASLNQGCCARGLARLKTGLDGQATRDRRCDNTQYYFCAVDYAGFNMHGDQPQFNAVRGEYSENIVDTVDGQP